MIPFAVLPHSFQMVQRLPQRCLQDCKLTIYRWLQVLNKFWHSSLSILGSEKSELAKTLSKNCIAPPELLCLGEIWQLALIGDEMIIAVQNKSTFLISWHVIFSIPQYVIFISALYHLLSQNSSISEVNKSFLPFSLQDELSSGHLYLDISEQRIYLFLLTLTYSMSHRTEVIPLELHKIKMLFAASLKFFYFMSSFNFFFCFILWQ